MRPRKPAKFDRRHPEAAREPMEDIKDISIRYMEPNRDRALGEADRTGRHFDEEHEKNIEENIDFEGTEASEEHEAD